MGRKVLGMVGKRHLRKFLRENLLRWDEDDDEIIVDKWTKEIEYASACGCAQISLIPWETIDGGYATFKIDDEDLMEEIDFAEPVPRLYGSWSW
jgi:hypothetical protein